MSSLTEQFLFQLTVTRFRLILREPEAIFWVFVFPILLAVGLGIAFRNRPADVLPSGRDDDATGAGAWRRQGPESHRDG